jgi:hypothetical protein
MCAKVCEIVQDLDKQQKEMKEDLISLEKDVQKIRDEMWESYIPLFVLIGTYALMCYNTSYTSEKVKPIIVPLDRDFNTIEFRR